MSAKNHINRTQTSISQVPNKQRQLRKDYTGVKLTFWVSFPATDVHIFFPS